MKKYFKETIKILNFSKLNIKSNYKLQYLSNKYFNSTNKALSCNFNSNLIKENNLEFNQLKTMSINSERNDKKELDFMIYDSSKIIKDQVSFNDFFLNLKNKKKENLSEIDLKDNIRNKVIIDLKFSNCLVNFLIDTNFFEFSNKDGIVIEEINMIVENSTLNILNKLKNCKINLKSNNSKISIPQIDNCEFNIDSTEDILETKLYDINYNSILKVKNTNLRNFKISYWSALKMNIFFYDENKCNNDIQKQEYFEKQFLAPREGYNFCPNLIIDIDFDEKYIFSNNFILKDFEFKRKYYLFYNPFKNIFESKEYLDFYSKMIKIELNNNQFKFNFRQNSSYWKRSKIILLLLGISVFYFQRICLKEYENEFDRLYTYLKYSQLKTVNKLCISDQEFEKQFNKKSN